MIIAEDGLAKDSQLDEDGNGLLPHRRNGQRRIQSSTDALQHLPCYPAPLPFTTRYSPPTSPLRYFFVFLGGGSHLGIEKSLTARDVTGRCVFFIRSGNLLHIWGVFPNKKSRNPGEQGKNPLEKIQTNTVETAPRDCRLLFFVVVEDVLINPLMSQTPDMIPTPTWIRDKPLQALAVATRCCISGSAKTQGKKHKATLARRCLQMRGSGKCSICLKLALKVLVAISARKKI